MVDALLRTYNEWRYQDLEGPFADFRIDIDRALKILTPDEQRFVYAIYFRAKEPPVRNDKKGRPSGGTSQTSLAALLANTQYSSTAQRAEITRRKNAICAKLADHLGDDYR